MSPSSTSSYRKLPGRGGSAFQRHRLWLGADHVLSVGSTAVGERYRRFYFADIQGFIWRPTLTLWIRALAGLLIAALLALGIGNTNPTARIVFASLAGLCVLAVTLDLSFGRTCACFVKTAVQFEPLPSLGRLRQLRKVLAQLRPLIEQAQAPH